MVYLILFTLLTATTLVHTEAKKEWISRPRSRLFVNAGETSKIKWKFPAEAAAITYEKKTTILGDGIRIAYKLGVALPVIVDEYKNKIRIEKSGALSILKAGLKDEGFYVITITYKSNTLKDEVEIKIQEAPIITTFPTHTKSAVFYMGMTINLLCMAKGRPVPDVQWVKDGQMDKPLKKSAGSIVYQIKSAKKEDSGRYTCVATNQAGKAKRSIEYIILRRPYDIEFFHNTALDGTIYEGESVSFYCSAKGNPPITYYKLLHNGQELVDKLSSGKYKINEVRLKDNGTYCCIPINKAGLGENKTVALNVKDRPGYWEEKLRKTTIPPTEEVTVITEHVDATEQQTTETLLIPTKGHVGGAGNTAQKNTILLFLLCISAETITQLV